jgi:hypothetical protein
LVDLWQVFEPDEVIYTTRNLIHIKLSNCHNI